MADLIASWQPWIKVVHLCSVILWMGSQSVLPMLLVAHADIPSGSAAVTTLLRVERRLVRYLLNPAISLAFLSGGLLAWPWLGRGWSPPPWLAWKLVLVLALAALHGRLLRQYWRAGRGERLWGAEGYRRVQAAGLILMVVVVSLAVAKPGWPPDPLEERGDPGVVGPVAPADRNLTYETVSRNQ